MMEPSFLPMRAAPRRMIPSWDHALLAETATNQPTETISSSTFLLSIVGLAACTSKKDSSLLSSSSSIQTPCHAELSLTVRCPLCLKINGFMTAHAEESPQLTAPPGFSESVPSLADFLLRGPLEPCHLARLGMSPAPGASLGEAEGPEVSVDLLGPQTWWELDATSSPEPLSSQEAENGGVPQEKPHVVLVPSENLPQCAGGGRRDVDSSPGRSVCNFTALRGPGPEPETPGSSGGYPGTIHQLPALLTDGQGSEASSHLVRVLHSLAVLRRLLDMGEEGGTQNLGLGVHVDAQSAQCLLLRRVLGDHSELAHVLPETELQ